MGTCGRRQRNHDGVQRWKVTTKTESSDLKVFPGTSSHPLRMRNWIEKWLAHDPQNGALN